MATYLATAAVATQDGELFEEITLTYCSKNHADIAQEREGWSALVAADYSYEFDETCETCGLLIPASEAN